MQRRCDRDPNTKPSRDELTKIKKKSVPTSRNTKGHSQFTVQMSGIIGE